MARVSNEVLAEKIDSATALLTQVIDQHGKQIESHNRAIFGNGKPGLVADVGELKIGQRALLWTVRAVAVVAIAELIALALP